MKNLKIGIYTICKNEIKKIKIFLEKNKEADFIAILDTGSSDGTFEFLKEQEKLNSKLYIEQKIINPFRFDSARNISLEMLPEYIDIAVSIDIDEYFEKGWTDVIKRNWNSKSYRFWYDWIQDEDKWTKSFIHKNNKNFKWYYAVHEMLGTKESEPKGNPIEIYPKIDLILHHHQERKNHNRESLYTSLLPIRIAEAKEDVYGKTMLAFEYGNFLSNPKDAALLSKEILEMQVSGEYEKHLGKREIEQAIHVWFNQWGLKEFYENKNYEKALECFQTAYSYSPEDLYRKNIKITQNTLSKDRPYKISVYTITKNEEKFVDEWVDNMFEADEIVVLDTGSTDKTVEKLRARGVKVETKIINPWRFDVARNESMKLISPEIDICVCTDLDEKFEKGWADSLRKNWNENVDRAKYSYAWNHDEFGNIKVKIWYEKIHKNDGSWKWIMPVHEILFSEKENVNWIHLPENEVMLHHYPDMNKPRSQYLNLMKLGMEEDPKNFLQGYYYGRELFYYKKWEESIQQLQKTLNNPEIKNYPSYIAASYGFIGECYEALGKFFEAESNYIMGLKNAVGFREPFIKLIEFYYRQEKWYSLIEVGLQALKIEEVPGSWYEDERNFKEIPYDFLSLAFYNTNQYEKGLEYLNKAIEYNPQESRFWNNREHFLKKLNK